MDPADAVEPIAAKEAPKIKSSQSTYSWFEDVFVVSKQALKILIGVCVCVYWEACPYPKFMRRVCAGKPGGMASRERKVQWTSLAW